MKSISLTTSIFSICALFVFESSAQTIPALSHTGYPSSSMFTEGSYKREQRIITKFKSPTAAIKDLQLNMRSVGRAYVQNTNGQTTASYTYTEISGIRREDGKVKDLGNPIEDKTEYAYVVVYDNESGQCVGVKGRPVYTNWVAENNVHDLNEGAYFMYFFHTEKSHKIGDVWTDSIFSFPLTNHIPMTFTFEGMETFQETELKGKTGAKLVVSGNVNYEDVYGQVLKEQKVLNMKGTVSGTVHVDIKTNRILRIKVVLNLEGTIETNGVKEPYSVEMKINEWEMDPKML
jgi:hypothetical protein